MTARPHGGKLINRVVSGRRRELLLEEAKELTQIKLSQDWITDLVNIARGVFSPLEGFMTQEELLSVLYDMRLPSDLPWTIPIVLDVDPDEITGVKEGDDRIKVRIFDVKTGRLAYEEKLPCSLSGRRWVESLAFNRDHIVVSTGKYIHFWDVNEEKMVSKEGEGYFWFLSFSPVEPRLVSWSEGNLTLWDMSTYSPIRTISAPKGKQWRRS